MTQTEIFIFQLMNPQYWSFGTKFILIGWMLFLTTRWTFTGWRAAALCSLALLMVSLEVMNIVQLYDYLALTVPVSLVYLIVGYIFVRRTYWPHFLQRKKEDLTSKMQRQWKKFRQAEDGDGSSNGESWEEYAHSHISYLFNVSRYRGHILSMIILWPFGMYVHYFGEKISRLWKSRKKGFFNSFQQSADIELNDLIVQTALGEIPGSGGHYRVKSQ